MNQLTVLLRRAGGPVVVVALIGIAGLSLDRVYNGQLLVELVLGAAIGSVSLSAVLRRVPAWVVAPISVLAMAAYALLAVSVSARAGGVGGDLLTLSLDAARNAVPRLLTALIPVEPQPDTVLGPVVLAWLAGFAATELGVRARRPALALLPPTLLYVGALVLVGPNAGVVGWQPLAFAAVAAAGLAASEASSAARALPKLGAGQRAALRVRTGSGLALGLVAVLAVVAVAAALVGSAVRRTPTDPRRYVAPPNLDVLDQNPLVRIAAWAANPEQRLFDVDVMRSGKRAEPTPTATPAPAGDDPGPATTAPAGGSGEDRGAYDTRLRLAILTDWDGVTWHVNADYRSAGRVLPPVTLAPGMDKPDPDAPPPLNIEERITVDELEGRLMPAVSAPSRVDGVRVAFDQSSGTLLRTDPLGPGVQYTVTSTSPSVNVTLLPAADVPSGKDVARYLAVGDQVPTDLTHLAEQISSGAGSPYLKALALESFLKEHYTFASDAPSGHAYPNLRFFLFTPRYGGGQRGTSEQFTAAFAALGRLMGLPTRVVVGFRTPAGGGTIHGADAVAWPEVLFSGVGWVAFDPLPDDGTPPRPLEDEYLPKPPPPTSPPASVDPPTGPAYSAPPHSSAVVVGGGGVSAGLVAGGVGGGLILLLVLLLVLVLVLRGMRRRSRLSKGPPQQRVLGAWSEVLDALVLAGAPAPPHLAAAEVAEHAGEVAQSVPRRRHASRPRPAAPPLYDLADKVNAVGFAGQLAAPDEPAAHSARAQALEYERALRAGRGWWRRLVWSVDPRPLWRRDRS